METPQTQEDLTTPREPVSPAAGIDQYIKVPKEDLISDAQLRSILVQNTPLVMKDITLIEKGVENFFLFKQSPQALTSMSQMTYLTSGDIKNLEMKNALSTYLYLEYLSESGRLNQKSVIIRPISLKIEQLLKVKKACLRFSAISLLQWIRRRDLKNLELERKGELRQLVLSTLSMVDGSRVDGREAITREMSSLRNVTLEFFLEDALGLAHDFARALVLILQNLPDDLNRELSWNMTLPPEVTDAISLRGTYPVSFPIAPGHSLIQPVGSELLEVSDSGISERKSEVEYFYDAYRGLMLRTIQHILPTEEQGAFTKAVNDAKMIEELRKHPSFLHGDQWPDATTFVDAFEQLSRRISLLKKIRIEVVGDLLTLDVMNKLNMQFEPIYFDFTMMEWPEHILEYFSDREELQKIVIDRIKKNSEIIRSNEENGKLYLIYGANLARAFIRNRRRRSFLHIMSKDSGYPRGIYDFLNDAKGLPSELVEEQLDLVAAIKEWEDDLEKERQKREKKSFFVRLIEFIIELFTGPVKPKTNGRSLKKDLDEKRTTTVIRGPKEKRIKVSPSVQKIVDYVERNYRGLIWLDEVMLSLGANKQTEDQVGDMLYYDEEQRYTEVRPLIKVRRLFLRRIRENDSEWVKATLDYLENITDPKPEIPALIDYLRKKI